MNCMCCFLLYYRKKSVFINYFALFYNYPLKNSCNYAILYLLLGGAKNMWHITGYYKRSFVWLASALIFRAFHPELKNKGVYLS